MDDRTKTLISYRGVVQTQKALLEAITEMFIFAETQYSAAKDKIDMQDTPDVLVLAFMYSRPLLQTMIAECETIEEALTEQIDGDMDQ